MRKPIIDVRVCAERRKKLAEKTKGAAIVIPSHPEFLRNHDVPAEYRQDTNLFYYTGFEEPESVFVFRPGQNPETVMFVRPKDPLRETWDGFRYGPELAKKEFGFDKVHLISELPSVLPELLLPVDRVFYTLKKDLEFDNVFLTALDVAKQKLGRSGLGLKPVVDLMDVVGEQRLFKQPIDIEWQKRACEISSIGHIAAMKFTKPGVTERQVEATIRHAFMMEDSPRLGYNAIVATGHGATTLHYNFNDQVCQDGELLLIDMGAEYNYYTGDITRTFPVNGKFSDAQKTFYNCVLYAQKEILKMIKPGLAFKELQNKTIEILTDAMFELGLLAGSKQEAISTLAFKKYYPHGVSHWLGMDVHDAGSYTVKGESRLLEPGMVFTVEPGLYVPAHDESAPPQWRGMGVRIEDNVLVTETGHFNMTLKAPKEVSDIEAVMA